MLAPIAMILIYIPILRMDNLSKIMKNLNFIGWIPMIIASYFNFKHEILPDGGFVFVNAVRPYNVATVIFGYAQVVYLAMSLLEKPQMAVICAVIYTVFLLRYFAKA